MDDADIALINEEIEQKLRLKYTAPTAPEAEATGFCLFCEAVTHDNRRWCDKECMDLWEIDKRRTKR